MRPLHLARPRPRAGYVVITWAMVALTGCSRAHYFHQANSEAKCLIDEKGTNPRWEVKNFRVEMDPRSRFYDPCDPICPPMPPDDTAAHEYMHCLDGKKGWAHWHQWGDRTILENPAWRQRLGEYAPINENHEVVLSLDTAVRVGYINSPTYHNHLETIYLSALDVSAERFRFDVRFFGGNSTEFTHLGRLRPGGERNTLTTDSDFQIRRRFATAGELLVGFANSFVWQFAGPDRNSTVSIVNWNLVQPLLRGAGRDIALEQLTIAERGLLANLRALAYYRQGYYTQVAIGSSGVNGPQRRGGFFGGTGLTGFTGQGSGGFGGVGEATGFGRGGGTGGVGGGGGAGTGFAGGGAGTVGGFIGLLQQRQQILNTEQNLYAQLRALGLLEAHLEAGTIDLTQVDQFRQNIETERATLLQSRNALENSLDSFKTGTLGFPPDVAINLDDTMVRQFQFIDPPISELQNRIADFLETFGSQPVEPELPVVAEAVETVNALRTNAGERFPAVDADLESLRQFVAANQAKSSPERSRELEEVLVRLKENSDEIKQRYAATAEPLEQIRALLAPATRLAASDRLVELVTALSRIVDELSLVQARARLEQVMIEPIKLTSLEALRIACFNRLDWMNNRAALVDTWRLIQFNADALQSTLNVTFDGDIQTTGDNPLRFRGPATRMSVGVEFDAPFTRLLERNNFRQVLIDYQRDRRQLIQFEDGIHQTLRGVLRQLEQLAVNLEIQRRAVAIAIRRVDQTREVLNQPPAPSQPGQAASQLGPTSALNLLTALSDLRSSQNNFMSVWLNYHAARMQLMRELGIMEIDENGLWIDRPLDAGVEMIDAEQIPVPPPAPAALVDALGAGESATAAPVPPVPVDAAAIEAPATPLSAPAVPAPSPSDAPLPPSPPVPPAPSQQEPLDGLFPAAYIADPRGDSTENRLASAVVADAAAAGASESKGRGGFFSTIFRVNRSP